MSYFVNFGTGAGNENCETLSEAKEFAESNCVYTQTDIEIKKNDVVISVLPWCERFDNGIPFIKFGDFGFYEEWIDA